jgi:hypothetical protein
MGSIVNSVADIFGVGPASQQAKGVESAAAASQAGTNASLALQREMFNKQIELQAPWREAGVNALGKLQGGDYSQTPQFAFNYSQNTDPGTQFRLQQGLNAMNATAAARGGLISGNALKAGQDYGQAQGSQEYTNAFNRYLTGYNADVSRANNMYNRVSNIAGTGQTTSNALATMAGNYGQNASNTTMQGSANRANSELQLGNIRGSQYGNLGNSIGQIGSMFSGGFGGGNGGASYSGPSYGTNSSFDNSWFDTNSYD